MVGTKGESRTEEPQDVDDEKLQDTFLSAITIGVIILLMWLWIFLVYLDRL